MIDTAVAYFLAGERCSLSLEFGYYGQHDVDAPTISNYAFSVELALKLLHHISSGKIITGHGLKDPFDTLPDDVRDNLPWIPDCIEEIDYYFVNWRYPFEREYLEGGFDNPRRSFIQCHQEIRRLRPRLVSIYEQNWGHFEPAFIKRWVDNVPFGLRELSS